MSKFVITNQSLVVITLFFSLIAGNLYFAEAQAHKGHAGKKITFVKKKVLLQALLPTEGKTYRRKEHLGSDQTNWVKKRYNIDIKSKIYAYYVSKNKATKQRLASAIIYKFTYRQGNCELAISLDSDNKVKNAAFVSINDKYLVDFEETIGTGMLKTFDGQNINELISLAEKNSQSDKATREFTNAIRDAALILIAFQQN